jgi:hypothetical protein
MNAIIQTSLLEKSYNKYYATICQKLGFLTQDFTQNFYGAIFDILTGPVKKYPGKKLIKLSKFLSDSLIMGSINSKLFKFMQVDSLSKPILQLGKLILKQIFQRMTKETLRDMGYKLAKKGENFDVCEHLRNITILILRKEKEYCKKLLK